MLLAFQRKASRPCSQELTVEWAESKGREEWLGVTEEGSFCSGRLAERELSPSYSGESGLCPLSTKEPSIMDP